MAQAKATDSRAASARPSRLMAGLLLAGTMLASAALAQEQQQPDPFADPVTADTFAPPPAAGPETIPAPDAIAAEDETQGRTGREGERLNMPQGPVEGSGTRPERGGATGIRLGSFVLKPSLSQGIATERSSSGGTATTRSFSETGFRGSLVSDWSRHQLTIDADGVYQRNIGGSGETEPSLRIGADLRLDLADDTVAHLTAGYDFSRESSSDPNAIAGASVQSGVHGFEGGASVTRDFGLIRGTLGAAIRREIYGSATLADGFKLSLSDRDNVAGTLTARVGYELSPALIPYLEVLAGQTLYDEKRDSSDYERAATTLGGRAGLEVDLGEKLRGDLGFGYRRTTLADARLAAIEAATVDGSVFWSPQRGTDLRLGLATSIEPSTAADQSGYVAYEANAELAHELRDNLVARLSGAYTWRDLPITLGPDQHIYTAGAGLTWDINRWLALTGDVSYELTRQAHAADTGVARAGIGLTLRR